TVAANDVDFFEPLKPDLPDEPHEMALPALSVIVTSVSLNVAVIWTTPSASTCFLARLALGAAAAAAGAGVGAGVGVGVSAIYFFASTFFFPAMALRGPFLVRALVWVRCPRTGRPFLCRRSEEHT